MSDSAGWNLEQGSIRKQLNSLMSDPNTRRESGSLPGATVAWRGELRTLTDIQSATSASNERRYWLTDGESGDAVADA